MPDPATLYVLSFWLLSALLIGLAAVSWPRRAYRWRIVAALLAALLAVALAWLCAWLLIQGQVSQFILPVADWLRDHAPSALGGVADSLERMAQAGSLPLTLVVILVFLGLYALLRGGIWGLVAAVAFLMSAVVGLITWFARKFSASSDAQPEPSGERSGLPPSGHFLIPAGSLALFGLAIALAALPLAREPLADYLSLLFWAGGWIALIEVWGSLRAAKRAYDEEQPAEETPAATSDKDLGALFETYRTRHAAQLLEAYEEPPQVEALPRAEAGTGTETPFERDACARFQRLLPQPLADRLLGPLRDYAAGRDLLFTETLSALHFLLLTELIEDCLRGGDSVLVLCARPHTGAVEQALWQQFENTHIRLTRRVWVVDRDPITPDSLVDIAICPDDVLGEALHGAQREALFERLGLLVALDVQAMNLSRLRLDLSLLTLGLRSRSVRKFFHAEAYRLAESSIRELVSVAELCEHRLNPELTAHRYLLLWDAGLDSHEAVRRHYFEHYPAYIDLALLACLPAWEQGFGVSYLDPRARRDQDLIERLRNEVLPRHGGAQVREVDWSLFNSSAHPAAVNQNTVGVVENTHNLVLALGRSYHYAAREASLVNIVVHNYLLRDYLLARLREGQGALSGRLPEALRPCLPPVHGNLPELARHLARALSTAAGLTRDEVARCLGRFPDSRLLRALQIDATCRGLKNLFAAAPGTDSTLRADHGLDGARRYTCSKLALGQPMDWDLLDAQGQRLGRVKAADHGLCYIADSYMLIDGKYHRITQVDSRGESVRVAHQDDSACKRYRYFFERTYRLQNPALEAGMESAGESPMGEQQFPSGLRVQALHQRWHYRRITHGFVEVLEDMRPFDREVRHHADPVIYRPLTTVIERPRHWQSVARLRFLDGRLAEIEQPERLAFTLCALLQECFYSLFPEAADCVAVTSPRRPEAPAPGAPLEERFPDILYPKLELPETVAQDTGAGSLELWVIEDADEDQGVVRSFTADYRWPLRVAFEYLTWARNQPPETLYHSFGADAPAPAFDYTSAHALLEDLLA